MALSGSFISLCLLKNKARASAREQLWSGEGGLQGKLTASGLLSEECEDFLESL